MLLSVLEDDGVPTPEEALVPGVAEAAAAAAVAVAVAVGGRL